MKTTKYFDKDIYKTENKLKTAITILIIFLLGLYIGLAINYMELQNKDEEIRNKEIEIVNLKEIIYQESLKDGR